MALILLIVLLLAPLLLRELSVGVERRARRRAWNDLGEEFGIESQVAYKTAQVLLSPDGLDAVLTGVTAGGEYRVDARAVCPTRGCDAPGLDCVCGFYAFKTRAQAVDLLRSTIPYNGLRSKMLLTVELDGAILQYELGYRAENQRVMRVEIAPVCHRCEQDGRRRAASTLAASPAYRRTLLPVARRTADNRYRDYAPVRPVCDEHLPFGYDTRTLTPAQLAGLLGTEVRWMQPPNRRRVA